MPSAPTPDVKPFRLPTSAMATAMTSRVDGDSDCAATCQCLGCRHEHLVGERIALQTPA